MKKTNGIIRFNHFKPALKASLFSLISLIIWNFLFSFLFKIVYDTHGIVENLPGVAIVSFILFVFISIPASFIYLYELFFSVENRSEVVKENVIVLVLSNCLILVSYLYFFVELYKFFNK